MLLLLDPGFEIRDLDKSGSGIIRNTAQNIWLLMQLNCKFHGLCFQKHVLFDCSNGWAVRHGHGTPVPGPEPQQPQPLGHHSGKLCFNSSVQSAPKFLSDSHLAVALFLSRAHPWNFKQTRRSFKVYTENKSGFRIRIQAFCFFWSWIQIQGVAESGSILLMNPDQIRNWIQTRFFFYWQRNFFIKQLTNHHPYKGHSGSRRSLQPSRELFRHEISASRIQGSKRHRIRIRNTDWRY